MGRKVTVGIVPGGIGGIAINDATIVTADTDANLTLRPDGTGEILSHSHVRVLDNHSIKFYEAEGNGNNFVGITSPASVASDVSFILPGADGTNGQVIKTDGSGNLSFVDAGLAVTNDTTTNTTYYPAFIDQTSGSETGLRVSNTKLSFNPSSGTLTVTALSAGSITETSSIALKENLSPIENALDSIVKLQGMIYDRKDGTAKNEAGLIAEEVEQVLPNLVQKDENGNPASIMYTKLTAYLIEGMKELIREVDQLKGKK